MSEARLIDGTAVAGRVRERVRGEVQVFHERHGYRPALATVLVGDDPASGIYVGRKERACKEAGIGSVGHELPVDTSTAELRKLVAELNGRSDVHGILVQLPLPKQVDEQAVVAAIDPAKDVDGLTPHNAGLLAQGRACLVPCTPAGVMELLSASETVLDGAEAVVLGRSNLVGKPLALLLLGANATVTMCHSRTREVSAVCSRAEVLVVAAGVPKLVGAEMVREGATVIDVGINRTEEGLVGDVDFEAARSKARAITPVPGGVGPMTIAMLLANTLRAARLQAGDLG